MTNEKAREYFSAYSEGTLDAGLAQSFEAKLRMDSGLKAEYEQFESTLKELESLRFEQVEVPFDLNDRISAAVDKSIYEKKRTAQPAWTVWLRNLAFGGLATAALFGGYLSIVNRSGDSNPSVPASPFPSETAKPNIEQIEYKSIPNGVRMEYKPTDKHTVSIKGGSEGEKTFNVDSTLWLNRLTNDQPSSAVFTVEVKGEVPATMVVVPGTEKKDSTTGQGSILELAKAAADKYGVPVILKSNQAQSEISWNLAGEDAHKAMQDVLQGMPIRVDIREGILYIGDN